MFSAVNVKLNKSGNCVSRVQKIAPVPKKLQIHLNDGFVYTLLSGNVDSNHNLHEYEYCIAVCRSTYFDQCRLHKLTFRYCVQIFL